MSRTLYEVAASGRDDLYLILDAFSNFHAIFELTLRALPQDHAVHALAELGMLEVADWSGKVERYAQCMDDELDDFTVETLENLERTKRRLALCAGEAQ
jgi:hypothetical protein